MKHSRRSILKHSLTGGAATLLSSLPQAQAQNTVSEAASVMSRKRPKGIVFMVSDGMSQGVLSMTEAFSQQVRNKGTRWWNLLSDEHAVHGLMDTASENSLVTDSAAASSAWSSGKRIPNGQINIDANGKELESIGKTLSKSSIKLGLVSTASITHATPAGFAAAVDLRTKEHLIAPQYLDVVDVILGGGRKFFDRKKRKDKKDIFALYEKSGYQVMQSRDELLKASSKKLLGTFYGGHMPFSIDHEQSKALQKQVPTLAEMTEVAMKNFTAKDQPFLLQVEGARIDHAAHKNDIGSILREQLAFDDAVAKVLTMTAGRDDILVVITSDHGNSNPGLNGTGVRYAQTNEHYARISKITGSVERFLREKKAASKSTETMIQQVKKFYGFTPSKNQADALIQSLRGENVHEWSHQHSNPVGLLGQIVGNETGTGWTGVCHTSDPTQVTAYGPGAESFHGLIRNDSVREKILNLLIE